MQRYPVAWLLTRLLSGAVLLGAGRGLDLLAGFRAFAAVPGFALLAALLGLPLCILTVRELAAAAGGLAESGPYYLIRHPLDLGAQLVLFGAALGLRSPGAVLAAGPLALLLWSGWALLVEEPSLRRRFGRAYERYRRDTGFFFPSPYVWSSLVVYLYYRLVCGLSIRGRRQIPRRGPFFLIALHRAYGDPFIIGHTIPRKVHYIATSVLFRQWLSRLYFKSLGCVPLVRSRADLRPLLRSFQLLDSGGVVGLFPEGARSWYGETACEPAVFKLLERRRVPIVTVEASGTFEHHPRFNLRLHRVPIRLRYRLHPPGTSQRLIETLLRRERERDARLRALGLPLPARTAEQLVYVCPLCAAPFRGRGYADGSLRCRACGGEFTLLAGKGLRFPSGEVLSLPELEKRNLAWALAYDPAGRMLSGKLVHRWTERPDVDLLSSLRLRRQDNRGLVRGGLRLYSDRLVVQTGEESTIPFSQLDSVLVESNWKLELSYRVSGGGRGYVLFFSPHRYTVFLQHFLRLKAFGSPYARYRGSSRREILPVDSTPGPWHIQGRRRNGQDT